MPDTRKELPKVLSLFCGAGGLDWGFKQVGFEVVAALDKNKAAILTHKKNFPSTDSQVVDLATTPPQTVLSILNKNVKFGSRIGVIGGPPCQGFSRANTGSRPEDPRNLLPQNYLNIVRKLKAYYKVDFVVFENVLGIRDKKHRTIYSDFVSGVAGEGFSIQEEEFCALDFGVPQTRKRVVLLCLGEGTKGKTVEVKTRKGLRTVREAIEGLCEPAYYKRDIEKDEIPFHPNHWTMRPRSIRFQYPDLPQIKEGRSFKRLQWDRPSHTVAYGHREIHVNPDGRRRLSIYEALLLQGFPADFYLEGNFSDQVDQVSNAVPPPLAISIAEAIKKICG